MNAESRLTCSNRTTEYLTYAGDVAPLELSDRGVSVAETIVRWWFTL